MKTLLFILVFVLISTSLFSQSGVMFGINLSIEKKSIEWNQELTYFNDYGGIGFHFSITKDIKYGFAFSFLPLKIKEGKVSPVLKFKQTFNGNEYFTLSGILRQNNIGTEFVYNLGIKSPDNFRIGLLYLNDSTE